MNGAPLDRLSLRAVLFDQPEELAGGDHIVDGGYRTVVDTLSQGLDIAPGTPVSRIAHSPGGVTVRTAGGPIDASHAIVTVPLGVLKAGSVSFDPVLPSSKLEAIGRLGFGRFEKVVLVFEERFWGENLGGGLAVLSGFGTDRSFPLFVDLSDFAGATRQLESGLGRPVPAPAGTLATQWATDPYSLGSYSFVPVGSSREDMDELAEPVGGRLPFAGEATVADHPQSVHGAFMSGLREARRIARNARIV